MDLRASGKRFILLGVILAVHIVAVLGPAGCFMLQKKLHEKEEIPFKVKLGGFEPSHAPELGEPERIRPNPDANVPPPPEDEPDTPEVMPEKKSDPVPVPVDKDKAAKQALLKKKLEMQKKQLELQRKKELAKKKEAELKRKKDFERKKKEAELKRRKDLERKKKEAELKRKKDQERKRKEAELKKRQELERKKKELERKKKEAQSVYHDKRWDNWDPDKPATAPGGKNFNKNVKIGSKDRGQKIGEVDGRTPAGGASDRTAKYKQQLSKIVSEKWRPPAGVFLTAESAVEITLEVSVNGSVKAWISKRSSNQEVNNSVADFLKNFTRVPQNPPEYIRFTMRLINEY